MLTQRCRHRNDDVDRERHRSGTDEAVDRGSPNNHRRLSARFSR